MHARGLACSLALGLACSGAPAEAPPAPERPKPEEPEKFEPPERTAKRLRDPADPPPTFVDPDRRAKLETALPKIEAYLDSTVERDHLVGLAAAVVIDGEVAWFKGWGHRDPARELPVTRDTLFGVGSISKTITTLAILKLAAQGRVSLDRPASDYLPELAQIRYPTADSPAITLRHILSHTSGLPRMGAFAEYPEAPMERSAFLATLEGLALERAPGERRAYSNLAFQLLGPLIDNVAGEDHRSYTLAAILRPLGIEDAAWVAEDVPGDMLAVGHEKTPGGEVRPRPHWRPGAADAAGGLYLSVDDLARYAAYNLDAWPPRSEPERGPLARATLRDAHTLHTVSNLHVVPGKRGGPPVGLFAGTGHSFAVFATCRHEFVVAHAGKTLNYRAALHMLPWHGVAVVLLSNHSSISSQVLPGDGLAMLDLLADTGALQPRQHSAAPELIAAAGSLGALVGRWDVETYAETFSDDYRDAYPVETTEKKFGEWRELVGACRDPQGGEVVEPRAGIVELACDRGVLRLDLRVGPWTGGGVTSMSFVGATGLDVSAATQDAAERALKLVNRWDGRAHARLFSEALDAERMGGFLEGVRGDLGRCRLGEPRLFSPKGASYGLDCERGAATMRVSLSSESPPRIDRFEIVKDHGPGVCNG